MSKLRFQFKDGTWGDVDVDDALVKRIMRVKRAIALQPNDENVQDPEHFALLELIRQEVAQYDADCITVAVSRIAGSDGGRPATAEADHDQWLLMWETEIAADEREGTRREPDVMLAKLAADWALITNKAPLSIGWMRRGIAEARKRQK